METTQHKPLVGTKEEHRNWADHPITQAFLLYLVNEFEANKQRWSEGFYTEETVDGTAQKNAKAIGKQEAIHDAYHEACRGDFLTLLEEEEDQE